MYILSDYLELTKDGFQGEICVAGNALALGYVDMKEEADDRLLVDNPHDDRENYKQLYRTGDYGRIEKLGGTRFVFIEGRTDTQMNVRGQSVILDEIEELLRRNEKIQEAYLAVYEPSTINQVSSMIQKLNGVFETGKSRRFSWHDFCLQKIVGFVLPKTSFVQALTPAEVRGALSNQIPDYLLPDIKVVEEIPRVGKFLRVSQHQLLRFYEEEREICERLNVEFGFVNRFQGFDDMCSIYFEAFSSWGKLKVPADKLSMAKILLEGLAKFAGIPVEIAAESLTSTFYELGGTSINTLTVLLYLHKNGCTISTLVLFLYVT